MVNAKVGGKLYWGGEYAVVESGYTAVIMGVERYLKVTLDFSAGHGNIQSSLYHHGLLWSYQNGKLHIDYQDEYSLIIKAIEVMSEYLQEHGIPLKVFDLQIDSDLHDSAFQKYGFGSSGAVIVAVVRGILRLYNLPDKDLLVFKLSCLILLKLGNNGSMGDVASCTYGGLIAYTSFDRSQILEQLKVKSIAQMVESDWQYLKIKALNNQLVMDTIIGWTGKEAISSELVYKVGLARNHKEYPAFLKNSEKQIHRLIQAIETGDKPLFKEAMISLRRGLLHLASISQVQIETEELKQLSDLANCYDAVGKLSGAGGGDCGIIFLFEPDKKEEVIAKLSDKGIGHLEFVKEEDGI